MSDRRDLELILGAGTPIIAIETADERRVLAMLVEIAAAAPARRYRPLFRWSVTDGLQRLDIELKPQRHNAEPADVLRHILSVPGPGIYVLLDFHPFLGDPLHVRLLKDIALAAAARRISLLLVSHALSLPAELSGYSARFDLRLPDARQTRAAVEELIAAYRTDHPDAPVEVDPKALELLVKNLRGLTLADTKRLARNAIYGDGAITHEDIPDIMQAKYRLLSRDGMLSFEYDTAGFAEIAGFDNLKLWLTHRKLAFAGHRPAGLDPPRGILLVGVQGCGKSLAAKAAAGLFRVPLLRLDFGALYDKYHGETEKNLRAALRTAEIMSPCVLWVDEIEKGLATGFHDSGTSRRVLGTFLTWLAERPAEVFLAATSNDITKLPPELVRKGRFDEIFFVDLPQPAARGDSAASSGATRPGRRVLRPAATGRGHCGVFRGRAGAGHRFCLVRRARHRPAPPDAARRGRICPHQTVVRGHGRARLGVAPVGELAYRPRGLTHPTLPAVWMAWRKSLHQAGGAEWAGD